MSDARSRLRRRRMPRRRRTSATVTPGGGKTAADRLSGPREPEGARGYRRRGIQQAKGADRRLTARLVGTSISPLSPGSSRSRAPHPPMRGSGTAACARP
jgi:hypothetical protein